MNQFEQIQNSGRWLRGLAGDRRGATAIEYAIIAGGISIFIVATVSAVGLMLRTNYFEPILAALVG